jgi:cell division septal protein FtsQ
MRPRPRARPRRLPRKSLLDRRLGRLGSLGLLLVLIALLAVLLASPIARVRRVTVSGVRHLSPAQVVALAGLEHPGSIFLISPAPIEARLETSPWVRSAQVSVVFPDQVRIAIQEWQPVAVYAAGPDRVWVSDQAVVLGPAGSRTGLVQIQGPAQPRPVVGKVALDPRLLVALVNIQRQLPGLIGQQVARFEIDACGDLTLVAQRGWQVQFGRVLTPEEFSSLTQKVAALRQLQLAGAVNYEDPRLRYVNVMNPAAVAVGLSPRASEPSPTCG